MNKTIFPSIFVILIFFSFYSRTNAATYTVSNEAELIAAIDAAQLDAAPDIINLTADITLTQSVSYDIIFQPTRSAFIIDTDITINGNGHHIGKRSLDRFRHFMVTPGGRLTLNDVWLSGGFGVVATLPGLSGGGAIYNYGGELIIINSEFSGNNADFYGGAIFNTGTLLMQDSHLHFNSASLAGGGIYTIGDATIQNSRLVENLALATSPTDGFGGGIYAANRSVVSIENSFLFAGWVSAAGGAIYSDSGVEMTIENSFVRGLSDGIAGGIYNAGAELRILNSSLGGASGGSGTAIYNETTLSLTHATVVGASSPGLYPIDDPVVYNSGTMTLHNSILTNDSSSSTNPVCENASGATFNADSYNIFGFNGNSLGCPAGTSSDIVPASGVESFLETTRDHSGAIDSLAPVAGGVAIDAANSANCPATDQRGVPRGLDGDSSPDSPETGDCDIGAFEYGATPVYPTVEFDSSGANYMETDGTVSIGLTVSGASNFAGEAEFYVGDMQTGTATVDSDYVAFPVTTITIDCSVLDCTTNLPQSVSLTINTDAISPEADETVILEIIGTNAFVNIGAQNIFTATIQSEAPPLFSKAFAPDTIILGEVSTLTFTIDSTANTIDVTALDFTDNLPAGMTVATPANASTTCTGGTLTAVDGSGVVSYTGGTVSSGASCTISVDVTGASSGILVNTTGDLTSSTGNSGTANANLVVNAPILFSKAFAPDTILSGEVSTLTFTIDSTANTIDMTALDFTDNLPAGMTVATPANASTTCTGGTITAVDGSSVVSYTGGTVSAGASCTISVDVVGVIVGTHSNISGDLTSSIGNSGTANADLIVNALPGSLDTPAQNTTSNTGIDVFDPAISKIGLLLPGQTGVTGEQVEWVVTVSNTGNVAGNNVTITDTLIDALRVDSVSAQGANVSINGQTVSVTYPTLNAGQTVQFSIFTTVLDGVEVNNTACVMADNQGAEECATGQVVGTLPQTGEAPFWRNMWLWLVLLLVSAGFSIGIKSGLAQIKHKA